MDGTGADILGSDGAAAHSARPAEPDEVSYRWSIRDDSLAWEGDVDAVLRIPRERIATGRSYASFLDAKNSTSRYDAVLGSAASDRGTGVGFQVEYALRPEGPSGPLLWVEDSGRWFGEGSTAPVRAVGVVRVVNDRHERERRLAFRSSHDELTGFFNRAYLIDLIDETIGNTQRFRSTAAFLLVAIDNFRLVNDCYGFDVADQVLAAVARRLGSRLRSGDAIGRFSGNKLGIILRECDNGTMKIAAERFLDAAREEVVMTDSGAIAVSVSIGGVTLPRHARTVGEAMSRAEESLHAARSGGPGRFAPYVHSSLREEQRRANAALSNELIAALAEKRLRLAFQPVVDIGTRRPVFHEALLRLERPSGEILPASAFMPLSEKLGLSRLLDQRALELLLASLAAAPEACVSLNVTADTVGEARWLRTLSTAASRTPGLARRLIVEITESSAIRNLDEAGHFIHALRELGARVAIDDFGAGYTSFRTLRQLDIDIVKIDGDFIRNLPDSRDDQVFVRTLSDLARNFQLFTVAEWVRDERSVEILAGYGVNAIQGDLTGEATLAAPARSEGRGASSE